MCGLASLVWPWKKAICGLVGDASDEDDEDDCRWGEAEEGEPCDGVEKRLVVLAGAECEQPIGKLLCEASGETA